MNTKSLLLTENDGGSEVALTTACTSALVAFVLNRGLGIHPPRDRSLPPVTIA